MPTFLHIFSMFHGDIFLYVGGMLLPTGLGVRNVYVIEDRVHVFQR